MSLPTPTASTDFNRRSANYHPSVWGDHFIRYVCKPMEVDETMEEHRIILKEKLRMMLASVKEKALRPLAMANLIDSIQRLGLYYHFEHEIGEILQYIHNSYVENGMITLIEDLSSVALIFRLLRQQGYRISSHVLKKFMDEEGRFNEKVIADVEGMISLYEAAHMGIHGEDILDEAISFTSSNLKLISTQLTPSLQIKVHNCLKRPLCRNLPRLVARNYISTYQENTSHDEDLLLFAKLDFNMLQTQHQRELGYISKWWKDLDFKKKLPFARDRIVEAYFWILGVYFEPEYSRGRILMTKVIHLTATIDDIYDVYGTLEELQLFTKAIQRWDISCMDFLPEYMKVAYKALLDVYEEIEKEMAKEGRTFCVTYVKNEIIRVVEAYFGETKWSNSNYTPTMEEYMGVALVTSAYRMLMTIAFTGMGNIATDNAFKWLKSDPKIVIASATISRLMDDIVSDEFERSGVEFYMKQHSVTRQETVNEFLRQVKNAWKDINEELLEPTQVPKPLLMRALNLARVMDVLYKDADGFTQSGDSTKSNIEALLLSQWPL